MIRIVHNGNSATRLMPQFDECIIESVENTDDVSFVMDVRNGNPLYKRLRSDEDVSDYISDLHEHDEISSIKMDEENHDLIITLRELGENSLEIDEVED